MCVGECVCVCVCVCVRAASMLQTCSRCITVLLWKTVLI